MSSLLEDSEVDFLFVVASREEVEGDNIAGVLGTFNALTASRNTALRFLGRIDFRIEGYDDDPRELFEISEVRTFLRHLDDQFPFWFFFLSTETEAIKLLMFSLCRIKRVSPTATAPNQEDFAHFVEHHLSAMNYVFDRFRLDEELNVERSAELQQYFLKSRILN